MTMTPFCQPACMSVRQLTKMSIWEADIFFLRICFSLMSLPKHGQVKVHVEFTPKPPCRLRKSPAGRQALFERMGAVGGQLL